MINASKPYPGFGERGFLSNYPPDVVAVVNGRPVTKGDILDNKRRQQSRELARKRQVREPKIVPCFIWVFFSPGLAGFAFYGWHTYVRTSRCYWAIDSRKRRLELMHLYPCGLLPIIDNYERWQQAFAAAHHHPTWKRPENNGLAVARAVVSSDGRDLLDVLPWPA